MTTRRAVFLDVDGTLVNDRGVIPDGARAAVRQARANGHLVFLSTGRSTSAIWDDILATGFDGLIAAAGGYIELDGTVLTHRTVDPEDVRRAIDLFTEHGIAFFLESNRGLFGGPGVQQRIRELIFGGVRDEDVLAELEQGLSGFIDAILPIPDPLPDDVNKISFLDSPLSVDEVAARLRGVFDVIPSTVPMFGSHSGEMAIPGVHKGEAVRLLIEHLGIPRTDTVAFGDGLNDLEMLRFVAVGVAMGNAHPQAVAAADRVTAHVDADGLRLGFQQLGLI